jgi:hypothetical protein
MAIPVLSPTVAPLILPSDIIAKIAEARQRAEAASRQAQAFPLMQQAREQQLQQSQEAFPLIQQLRQAQVPLAQGRAQEIQSEIAAAPLRQSLLKAQIEAQQAKAQDPFGGQILPGPAGQAQGLQILAQKVGTDSPVYQRALNEFNAALNLQKGRASFYSSNVALKNLSPLQKQQITQNWQSFNAQRQQQGLPEVQFQDWLDGPGANLVPAEKKVQSQDTVNHTPMSTIGAENPEQQGIAHKENAAPAMHDLVNNTPVSQTLNKAQATVPPEDFASESKQTQLKIAKEAGDPEIFRKWVNFNNITKMMNDVSPSVLERYTGPAGVARIARDRSLELSGTRVPEFEAYNNFVNVTVPNISDTIRQAYGTSITPEIFNVLKKMSNPISWKNSPSLAIQQWEQLQKEMQQRKQVLGKFVGISQQLPEATSEEGTPQRATQGLPAGVTQEDIEFTAKKKGLTVDEVKRRLGIR